MNIVFIITGLKRGGAELVLLRLIEGLDPLTNSTVISLSSGGDLVPIFREKGINVEELGMKPRGLNFFLFLKLVKKIKSLKPDVVQTFLYHSDLYGGLAAWLAGTKNIFWSVRSSSLEQNKFQKSLHFVVKLCALFSNIIPKKIIYCAKSSLAVHESLGFNFTKSHLIHNGYDIEYLKPNTNLRNKFRAELFLEDKIPIIGIVSRFHPMKNHQGIIDSLKEVKKLGFEFSVVMAGEDLVHNNIELVEWISSANLSDNIKLIGKREDISAIMNGLDILVLGSTSGEAFPNVLAEAMACGTPCISTDVGDAKLIIGDTGWILPINNSAELIKAIVEAIKLFNSGENWNNRKQNVRKRIVDNFNLKNMINSYQEVWRLYS